MAAPAAQIRRTTAGIGNAARHARAGSGPTWPHCPARRRARHRQDPHGAGVGPHCRGLRCDRVVGLLPEEAGAPPYWPWVHMIRAALRAADPRGLLRDVGSGASDICDIVPEIRDLLPELEPSARLEDAAQARFRMFESIATR